MMNIPLEERPRERLLESGVGSLKTSELLAIILGSGTKGISAMDLGEMLLNHFGDLETLVDASISDLIQIKGIGKAKAIELKAVFGLAKKLLASTKQNRTPILTSRDAFKFLSDLFYGEKQELLVILLLDAKLNPYHREIIGKGILTEVLVHPREVFAPALRNHAHQLIIAHNHPSGDTTPSAEDLQMTKLLKSSGEILGIPLIDHLIIADQSYYSFKDNYLLC